MTTFRLFNLLFMTLFFLSPAWSQEVLKTPTSFGYASYLGGIGDHDELVGVHIAEDGTLLVAANIGTMIPPGVKAIDLPGFQAPTEAIPKINDFEDEEEYLREGIAWIERNLPGAPKAPGLDDPDLTQAFEDKMEELSVDRKGRPRTPNQREVETWKNRIRVSAQKAHVNVWLNGWKGGALLRLSPDGQKVLSMVRIGPQVRDMSIDGKGRILVAAATKGVYRFEPDAKTVSKGWPKVTNLSIDRVDADEAGFVAAMGGRKITVLDPNGKVLSQENTFRSTLDVAISSKHGLYYITGFKVTKAPSQVKGGWKWYPVHIAHMQARKLNGERVWTNYDWQGRIKTDMFSDANPMTEEKTPMNFLNRSGNNMADTRGNRILIGDDGLLYASFEAAGGNHLFLYEPLDIMKRVGDKLPKIDGWHQFTNTTASHKGIIGRFGPKSGEVLKLQQFNTIVVDKKGIPSANGFRMEDGAFWVDKAGAVYLTGNAATGLPIRYSERFNNKTPSFNPFDRSVPTRGLYYMAISPDFSKRLFTARLSASGSGNAIHGRIVEGSLRVGIGGFTNLKIPSFTRNALQPMPGWGEADGYLAIAKPAGAESAKPSWAISLGKEEGSLSATGKTAGNGIVFANGTSLGERHGAELFLTGAVYFEGVKGAPTGADLRFSTKRQATQLVLAGGRFKQKGAQMRQWMAVTLEPQEVKGALGITRDDSFEAILNAGRAVRNGHFLVREGTQWFVREESLNDASYFGPPSDGDDGRWAPINLAGLAGLKEPPALLADPKPDSFTSQNFINVTAVGVLVWNDWQPSDNRLATLEKTGFQLAIDATDDPRPVAKFRATPMTVSLYDEVSFDSKESHDHGKPLSFIKWDLGNDGGTAGPAIKHRFIKSGRQDVRLTVWDANGASHETVQPIQVALPGIAVPPGQTVVASFGGNESGRYGFPKYPEGSDFFPYNPAKPLFKFKGSSLLGAFTTPGTSRGSFGDLSMRNVGTRTQPIMNFNAMSKHPKSVIMVAIDQKDFMGGADKVGADISQGTLHASGIKNCAVHWVIRTPNGWRISQKYVLAGKEGGIISQKVSEITWLDYDPTSASGKLLPTGSRVNEDARHVTAIGMTLLVGAGLERKTGNFVHGKGKFSWSTISATGVSK